MLRLCVIPGFLVVLAMLFKCGFKVDASVYNGMGQYPIKQRFFPQGGGGAGNGIVYIGGEKKKKNGDVIIINGGGPGGGGPLDYGDYGGADYGDYGRPSYSPLFNRPLGLFSRPLNRPSLFRRPLFG